MSLIHNKTGLNKANSNFTAIYIGIATYDDESIDQLIYSSENVMTHFARGIRQCSWFSTLMVNMKQTGTSPYTYETLKAADFLLSSWLRVKFPEVVLATAPIPAASFSAAQYGPQTRNANPSSVYYGQQLWQLNSPANQLIASAAYDPAQGRAFQVAWSPNPGHNIIRESKLYVNDVSIETLDHTWFDLISQFRISQGKIEQYQAMIGNVPAVTGWTTGGFAGAVGSAPAYPQVIPAFEVNVPQPYFYDRDSSTSFPLCGVTLNKVEIRVELRSAQDLLRYRIETFIPQQTNLQLPGQTINGQYVFIEVPTKAVYNGQTVVNVNNFLANPNDVSVGTGNSNNDIPQMWSRYAVVTKRERNAHSARGCKRDLLIEYVQRSDNSTDNINGNNTTSYGDQSSSDSQFKYEFIFNNPIRTIMYVAENVTAQENYHIWSNYSNNIELPGSGRNALREVSFRVDNTIDMYQNVPSVFFSHVDPFYVAERIPNKVGYNALFYCLDLNSLEADGSWNYNKVKGYISYQYSAPEGYLATGIYVNQGKQQTYGFSLTANQAYDATAGTMAYAGFVAGVNNITMKLKMRGLALNIIRLQDNVLGFPLG